jgi:hypothetical protein
MPFDAKLAGEAASLARAHEAGLRRLPLTVQAFILVDLQKWAALFPAEQRYQRTLLEHLSQVPPAALSEICAAIVRIESDASIDRIGERSPERFQDQAQAALRKQNLVVSWRGAIDAFFKQIDPVVEARLYPPDAPRRVVLQVYGGGIAVQPDRLWRRFDGTGTRIPLNLAEAGNSTAYLRSLFGVTPDASESSLFQGFRSGVAAGSLDPAGTDAWIIESHGVLHELLGQPSSDAGQGLTGLSYERLLPYRDALMRALFSKVQSGVESPQAFAAYARGLTLAPEPGVLLNPANIVQSFVRDVLLTGNGTLFVNNTFVEWAAAQALRRAQPRLLVARYGVRDKLKPFSSLLLFSQPRSSDVIPLIEDPLGSFIDVEQLVYYVWVHAEKSAAYRGRTLYLFLAENVPDMLAIRSDRPGTAPFEGAPATLPDVCATIAQWLGVAAPVQGRPIPSLVA